MQQPLLPLVPLGVARAAAARLLARLEREPAALRLAVGGEVRRMQPWVSQLELFASGHEIAPLLDALAGAPRVSAVLERTPTSVHVRLVEGLVVRLDVLASTDAVEARLQALGQPAERPSELGAAADLFGMQECLGIAGLFTREGTGRYSADEMATRAAREGFAWALLTPPPAAPTSATCTVLGAIEVEVGATPATTADAADGWRLVTPAAALREDGSSATRALVAALATGLADVAVPRGAGAAGAGTPYDVPALIAALVRARAALGVAPPPLHADPEPRLLEAALAAQVPLLLLADAHDLASLDEMVLSVGLARRAGARREAVLNSRSLAELEAWRGARRKHAT